MMRRLLIRPSTTPYFARHNSVIAVIALSVDRRSFITAGPVAPIPNTKMDTGRRNAASSVKAVTCRKSSGRLQSAAQSVKAVNTSGEVDTTRPWSNGQSM